MYQYYNANVLNKNVADCTVRAISCASNKSWDYVYDYLSNLAQKQGTMMDNREFIINFLDSKYKRIPVKNETVGELAMRYPNHVLLITMLGHITCSKNGGIVYDTFDCTNRKAEFCWLVK